MIAILRTGLLLLIATASSLMATEVNYGDGFVLTTTDGLNYFTVNPGTANAGTTSTIQSESNNVFQLRTYFGTDTGGAVTYGAHMSVQLPANKLWVTLNPSPSDSPYVRNNAPIPLAWENLYFRSINGSGSNGNPVEWNDHLYLAHISESGIISYVYLDTTNQTAITVESPGEATLLMIQSASFTPYTQTSTGAPINYGDQFTLQYGSYNFNVQPTSLNAGYIALGGWPSHYEMLSVNGDSGQAVYGAPIYLGASGFAVTLNPAPGNIRNNLMDTGGVWEKLYFIPVHGRNDSDQQVNIRNGDLMYSGDTVYLARNGLIEGTFQTEYVTIDGDGNVSTTFDFGSASLLQIGGLG